MVPEYPIDVIAFIGIKDEQDIEYEEVIAKYILGTSRQSIFIFLNLI